jgi:transcription initiation factor TFIIIB Brf1 subunit/transcription initiation factor TFIIB
MNKKMDITYAEFKKSLSVKLYNISKKLDKRDYSLIAYNLDLNPTTVKNYISGKIAFIKKLHLADDIYKEAERILEAKKLESEQNK